jgi:D-3-phosphoglycerate dehydrogenase
MKVLIAETESFSHEAILALSDFAQVVCKDINENEVILALKEYDVFWFRLKFKLNAKTLNQATRCKTIVTPVTGLDHIDLETCEKKGIRVLSLNGKTEFLKNIRATAEHTLALSLSLIRHIPQATNSTQQKVWNRVSFKGNELYEKKVGILGVGRLGSITASYFKAFGAKVYGYDIKPFDPAICTPLKSMNELFEISDLISVHVNLNRETKYLIGSDQFNLMKPGSWFVNTSRGQIVNSNALIEALENGQLAGAAVDVIEDEFNPSEDHLLNYCSKNNNLMITPHIGGNTFESFTKTELFMVEQLQQIFRNA